MTVAVAEDPTTAFALAERFRGGKETCRPSDLWRLANLEANGVREARVTLFRHAMIHAGYLTTKKGTPFKRCSMCHQELRR